jgi:hypothetical protein
MFQDPLGKHIPTTEMTIIFELREIRNIVGKNLFSANHLIISLQLTDL